MKVTSTECARDSPEILFEDRTENKDQCSDLCTAFSFKDCTFSAWYPDDGTCLLYKEPFWRYIGNCDLLAGPLHLADCNVTLPEDYSCDGVR